MNYSKLFVTEIMYTLKCGVQCFLLVFNMTWMENYLSTVKCSFEAFKTINILFGLENILYQRLKSNSKKDLLSDISSEK